MTWTLLVAATGITLASRVLPMTFLPVATGRTARTLEALPGPLFAGLAVVAIAGGEAGITGSSLLAAGGALLGASRRSLGAALVCGVAGFLTGEALWS